MKKIIAVLIFQMAALLQPCRAINNIVDQQLQFDDSLNSQMVDCQIKELEHGFLSSNHLKSGTVNINLPDSTHIYEFNSSNDSVLEERTLFSYDNAGKIKTELQYKWNQIVNRWLDFKYENAYDRSGKITSKKYNGWYIQYLQGMGNYRGFFYYKDTTVALPYKMSYPYEYNNLGQPSVIWRFTFDQYDTPVVTWYRCNYDSNGNITSIDGGWDTSPYVEEYAYDSNKTLVTVTQSRFLQYNYVSLTFCSSKIKYEYTYDSDNRVKNILSYYWSPTASEWHNVSKVDYNYQANGGIESRVYAIIDTTSNELIPADRTEFKYNKNDKIQLREDYAWNKTTSQWEIRKKLYYYYNNLDPKAKLFESNLDSEMPFSIFPNPAKDILWIENMSDDVSPLHIYNNKGQCVKTDKIEKGMNTISLMQLPKGLYYITIPVMNELKSCKLIIE
ncbi:MAG TPA: hypothetical protein DCL77_12015 [Prolixibacteraceae bacterium]|jgi:hypothetical protein|nr:hypothetical protein [Prolixibacteraceae bacterium]